MEMGKAMPWTCGRDTMDQFGVLVSAPMASFARVEVRTERSSCGSFAKVVTDFGSKRHRTREHINTVVNLPEEVGLNLALIVRHDRIEL